MPRVTLKAVTKEGRRELDAWHKRTGEGTSTWDVCSGCEAVLDGLELPTDLKPYNGEPEIPYLVESGVAHPPYRDGKYQCACCGIELTDEDK